MHKSLKFFLILSLCFLVTACSNQLPSSSNTVAISQEKLANCDPVRIETDKENMFINLEKDLRQKVYVLHNVSQQAIWVDRSLEQKKTKGMGAGWASQLNPDRWSALVLDQHNFGLYCMSLNAAKVFNCRDVLQICQLSNAQIPDNLAGSFWLTENKPTESLLAAIKARGVGL